MLTTPSAAPAFTTVTARRTFTRPEPSTTTTQAPPATKPAKPKHEWPQSVREYVQRCFAPEASIPGISHKETEQKLKSIITEAAEGNRILEIDWDHYPLPQQLIQSERAKTVAVGGIPWRGSQVLPAVGNTNVPSPSKRKSADVEMLDADNDALPPWRRTNKRKMDEAPTATARSLADRVDKRQHIKGAVDNGASKYQADLEKRRQRFGLRPGAPSPNAWAVSRNVSDINEGPIVGTCQTLEKKYFRLTAPPKPETVRPLHILRQTLDLLKKKWRKDNNYSYICDQFKSLRQDLTVQHIKNDFTVDAYEIHARIALEKGDLGEYNQCQTQLRALYAQNLGGHPAEFLAYRILYFIHTCNRTDMNDVLADLTPADKKQPAVKHALDVRSALALGNYHRFFRLYLDTPNMGAYLMDMFVTRERLAALANMCKAYKPDLHIRFLTEELGFDSDEHCIRFLCEHDAQNLIEAKDEKYVLHAGKAGSMFEQLKNGAFRRVDIKGQI
ncbi:SAC3/GANP domain protein [Saccharata proteae CBS 121410]|uniref:SAC3/GANP domain protein n=1 Tax=Saccharata proteae CBS 121410 TaxID=1314787 RepID=A0A9P4I2S8_9PEZI|nr:SAC3/GANP domain protein [Saccharata proteae CBS 121410]